MNESSLNFSSAGNPSNPTLVFLHGFLGSKNDWKEVCQSLSETYHCLAIDLPAHGDSNGLSEYDITSISEAIKTTLSVAGLKEAIFIGYSMGGRILLRLYKNHPEMFQALILESTSPGVRGVIDKAERLERDKTWSNLLKNNPENFIKNWSAQKIFQDKSRSEESTENISRRSLKNHNELAKILLESSPAKDVSNWDIPINVRTLLITGEFDTKYREILTEFNSLQPKSELKIVSNATHNTHLSNTDAFNEILKSFINTKNSKGVSYANP